jgi:putative protease
VKAPELLMPAGNLEKMRTAFAFGADAVYAGQARYSLRMRNNEFRLPQLKQGIEEAHALGKKFYLTANILPHNDKVKSFLKDMEPVISLGPDALIMADPGLISMVRAAWPEMPVHLSVQANTMNYAAARFWRSLGVERIILSRELRIEEVKEIREMVPDVELEVFVHGALCIAYSGRCLLSGYFNQRDSNQGNCSNACRWEYKVGKESSCCSSEANESFASRMEPESMLREMNEDGEVLIEDVSRPGKFMPVIEDENGTYIMNSKDLRAIEHVAQLLEIGVHSLKVEGRTKSKYYVARVSQAYRRAIDDAHAGRPFNPDLLSDLEGLANRGYTDGFFSRKGAAETQNYELGRPTSDRRYAADVLSYDDMNKTAVVRVRNKMHIGAMLEVVHPGGNFTQELSWMQSLQGAPMDGAPGDGYTVVIPLKQNAAGGMIAVFGDALVPAL